MDRCAASYGRQRYLLADHNDHRATMVLSRVSEMPDCCPRPDARSPCNVGKFLSLKSWTASDFRSTKPHRHLFPSRIRDVPQRMPAPSTLISFKTLMPQDVIRELCEGYPGLARRPQQVLRFRLWPHLSTYLGPATVRGFLRRLRISRNKRAPAFRCIPGHVNTPNKIRGVNFTAPALHRSHTGLIL